MDKTNEVLQLIADERLRQIAMLWPQTHDNSVWLMILVEELGEAIKSFFEGDSISGTDELIQAAAVLVAWIEDILKE